MDGKRERAEGDRRRNSVEEDESERKERNYDIKLERRKE